MMKEGKTLVAVLAALAAVLIIIILTLAVAGPWGGRRYEGSYGPGKWGMHKWDKQPWMISHREIPVPPVPIYATGESADPACPAGGMMHGGMMGRGMMPAMMHGGMMGKGMMAHGMMSGGGMKGIGGMMCSPLVVSGDGIYFVQSGRLVKMDAGTLKIEKSVELPMPESIRKWYKNMMQAFIRIYDIDGNGVVSKDEAPNPIMVRIMDADEDDGLSPEELSRGMTLPARMKRRGCAASVVVEDGNVVVGHAGSLYVFDAGTLELKKSAEIPGMEIMHPAFMGMMPGMAGGMPGGGMMPGMMGGTPDVTAGRMHGMEAMQQQKGSRTERKSSEAEE